MIEIGSQGLDLEIDEIDREFYIAAPDAVELITDLDKQMPDPADSAVLQAHQEAHRLWRSSRGEQLVIHWLGSREIGRYYLTDILGMLGLAMVRHPDLFQAYQSLINDIERHRSGTPPPNLAETVSPIAETHFRKLLAVIRFNFAEDLWREGEFERASRNVAGSLAELGTGSERWRRCDRLVTLAYLEAKLNRTERSNEIKRQILNDFTSSEIDESVEKWAPQLTDIRRILDNATP